VTYLRYGLSLALLGAGLTAVPVAATSAAPAASGATERPIVQRMKDDARGTARISTEPATGRVGFARAADLLPSRDADSSRSAAAKATAYLEEYAGAFGARAGELDRTAVRRTDAGWTVEYAQSYRGVPVFGAQLLAHVDAQGDLTSVNGFAVPGLDLSVTPRLSEADASAQAVDLVRQAPQGGREAVADPTGLEAVSTELMVYRMGSTRGVGGESVLAWVVEVTNSLDVRETVILDAESGKAVNRWSMIAHALDRELYEASSNDGGTPNDPSDDTVEGLDEPVWVEGDPFPADLDQDQQNEVVGTGEAYWMFMNTFGYDSYDGRGSQMITVNNDPRIRCPNANWNGTTTNYCSGVTSDDTVAHEWAHAYTEYTSGLVYQWQSGAMNEAYSDIWGETVDMLNDRMNTPEEEEPRLEGECSTLTQEQVTMRIVAPASVAGECQTVRASSGPDFPSTPTQVTLVTGVDADVDAAGPDTTTDGCSTLTNAADVAGKWLYLDENLTTGCGHDSLADYYTFLSDRAVEVGALGLVVGSTPPYAPWDMPGATFAVPAAQIDATSGAKVRSVGTVTMEVAQAGENTDLSSRWLSGEEDPAFGGAIRDMWNPTCYGDPGKVSDEEYHCDTSDSGGVHTNSGVVNHTFALMVDGGTSNGVEVPAVGLDKAANIFWRTQVEYLTPTSNFVDLADGLTASCTDLVGRAINAVTLGQSDTGGSLADAPPAAEITAADCVAVDAAIRATELRVEPVQCDFGPILQPGAPSPCGDGFRTQTAFAEDFEDGLAGWTQDEELDATGTRGILWEASTSAPGGHAGGVAYAPDPDDGQCGGDDDLSSRNGLVSPVVTYPAGAAARLSFDHYVATEVNYDGGNVKVSIDGGDYAVIPAAAYTFNAPGGTLATAEEDNTNPMQGEPAFTGTDGNVPGGSWGTSVVDLAKIPGATPGKQLRFRFDFGRDGCGGIDGWYVDNVTVTACLAKAASTVSATHSPEPSTYGEASTLDVTVTGSQPTGTVTVTEGGQQVGTAPVIAGRASVPLSATYAVGTHSLRVAYSGDADNQAASTTVGVTVAKAPSQTTATAPKSARAGTPVKVKVKVSAGSLVPAGQVVVRLKGKKVAAGSLDGSGRATLKVSRLKAGKVVLAVAYAGSGTIRGSVDTVTVRVIPKPGRRR
jgi:Zn-dependent metalloprotease/ribosomal protein L27